MRCAVWLDFKANVEVRELSVSFYLGQENHILFSQKCEKSRRFIFIEKKNAQIFAYFTFSCTPRVQLHLQIYVALLGICINGNEQDRRGQTWSTKTFDFNKNTN